MAVDDIVAGSGQCLAGPEGTTLPTDIGDMAALDAALVDLGQISEDGLETAFSVDKTVVRNWAGQAVRTLGTQTEITFSLTFLERGQDVVELFYGADVDTTTTASSINLGAPDDVARAMVIPIEDPSSGKINVYVLPRVEVSERDSQTIKPDEVGGYGMTFTALYDSTLGACGYILFDEDLTA